MLYQVKKLFKQHLFKQFVRNMCSTQMDMNVLYPLQSRSLLKVSGSDAAPFLQGLITNDMEHFKDGAKNMYAMFLNNKGRVLYDTIIYKWEGDNSFIVECDKQSHESILKHFKMYRLKRRVDLYDLNADLRLFVLITPVETEIDSATDPKRRINIYKDPRLSSLGHRVIVSTKLTNKYLENTVGQNTQVARDDNGYKYLRYKLGVSEGVDDITPGKSFPLETNCDYLHGVSFQKGCYIGQELTARVHHTGVVRKRVMPVKLTKKISEDKENIPTLSVDIGGKPAAIGKLINCIDDYGIGLVRYKEALDARTVKIGENSVEVVKPSWWPLEASKGRTTPILKATPE